VLLDRDGTIAKAIEAIDEAADAGASLLVFPEAWIPGYPTWVWTRFEHASEAHDANTDRFSAMVMSGSRTTSIGWRKALEGCSRACQMYLPGLKAQLHDCSPSTRGGTGPPPSGEINRAPPIERPDECVSHCGGSRCGGHCFSLRPISAPCAVLEGLGERAIG
jgi:hypothetical protein